MSFFKTKSPPLQPVSTPADRAPTVPTPGVTYHRGQPVLDRLGGNVQVTANHQNVNRAYWIKWALNNDDKQTLAMNATGQISTASPQFIETPAQDLWHKLKTRISGKQVQHGYSLPMTMPDLTAPPSMEKGPVVVSEEKMFFPGTTQKFSVRINEMYTTTAVNEIDGSNLKPPLAQPQHVGTVASFELGQKYLLHRKLDKAPVEDVASTAHISTSDETSQPTRRLFLHVHGAEVSTGLSLLGGYARNVDISDNTAISFSVLSGYTAETPKRFTLSDLVRKWPSLTTHKKTENTHLTRITAQDYDLPLLHMEAAALHKLAAGKTNAPFQIANVALGKLGGIGYPRPSETVVNIDTGRKMPAAENVRGRVGYPEAAFAALNDQNVDVLTVRSNSIGSLADLINTMRRQGILDQYEEILTTNCRHTYGKEDKAKSWDITQSMTPRPDPLITLWKPGWKDPRLLDPNADNAEKLTEALPRLNSDSEESFDRILQERESMEEVFQLDEQPSDDSSLGAGVGWTNEEAIQSSSSSSSESNEMPQVVHASTSEVSKDDEWARFIANLDEKDIS